MRPAPRAVSLVALVGALAACGGPAPTPTPVPTPTPSPTAPPEVTPGPVPTPEAAGVPALMLESLPDAEGAPPVALLVLYVDGRLLTPAAERTSDAIPSYLETRLVPEAVRAILDAAAGAGLDRDGIHETAALGEGIARSVSFRDGDRTVVSRLVGAPAPSGSALDELLAHLTDISGWLGTGAIAEIGRPYATARLAVTAEIAPYLPDAVVGAVRGWPLPAGPFRRAAAEGGCVLVEGDDLATLWPDLAPASADDIWVAGQDGYRAWFRALLPHEDGCPATS